MLVLKLLGFHSYLILITEIASLPRLVQKFLQDTQHAKVMIFSQGEIEPGTFPSPPTFTAFLYCTAAAMHQIANSVSVCVFFIAFLHENV